MKGRLNRLLLSIILIVTPLLWISAILWVPTLSNYMYDTHCADADATICFNRIASYGSTGDIFGAVTSLFSGLALFAVAFTLWTDNQSRREGRKPLLISNLDSDSLSLESPELGEGGKITLSASVEIANQTHEAALNVSVRATISDVNEEIHLPQKFLPAPLGGQANSKITFSQDINGRQLSSFLSALTQQSAQRVELKITIEYQSLENVRWATCAIYILTCNNQEQRRKLNSVRSNTDDFQESWANGAAVAITASIEGGSWVHKMV